MKASGRVLLFTAVLLYGIFMCASGSGASSSDKQKHKIQVNGGYAQGYYSGLTLTEAYAGERIQLIPELVGGYYVTEWLVNGEPVYELFDMPDYDVVITAVKEKQTPVTYDVTNCCRIYEKVNYRSTDIVYYIYNALGFSDTDRIYGIDIDGDGTRDLCEHPVYLRTDDETYLFRHPDCSVRGNYTIEALNNLPYWPVTIQFGSEPAKEYYSIHMTEGKAYLRDADSKKEVTSSCAGEWIELSYPWNEETYLRYWTADGVSDFLKYYDSPAYDTYPYVTDDFVMPSMDLTIHAVTGKKNAITINLTKGFCEQPRDVAVCVEESVNGIRYYYDDQESYDLDGDGTVDVVYSDGRFTVYSETCSVSGNITLSGLNSGAYWPVTFQFGEYPKTYPITVKGGHAEDGNGNRITESGSGKYVKIVRDSENGRFFKTWKSDSGIQSEYMDFYFVMPAKAVTLEAVTTTTQREYVFDLTDPSCSVPEEDVVSVSNMFYAIRHITEPGGYHEVFDLDQDGTMDISFADYSFLEGFHPTLSRLEGYSLGCSFSMTVNDGQIGKLTILVDNESTESPVIEKDSEKHSIYMENVTIGIYNDPYSPIIEKARYGTHLSISQFFSEPPEGCYFGGFMITDVKSEENTFLPLGQYDFYMPDYDILVSAVFKPRIPLVIDLTDGTAQVPEDCDFPLVFWAASDIEWEDASWDYSLNYPYYRFSLNGNAGADIEYDASTGILSVCPDSNIQTVVSELIFDKTSDSYQENNYFPVTLRFSDAASCLLDCISVDQNGCDLGNLVGIEVRSDSESIWLKYPDKYSYCPGMLVLTGTHVGVVFEGNGKGYKAEEICVRNKNGDVLLTIPEEEIYGDFNKGCAFYFDMPDEDSVIYIKVSNGAAPTGKPVPTVTEAVTPGPVSENVTPSPKAAANKKAKQNDSFPIILFLIPIITAALCIGAITFAVISKKKDKNKNNG